MDIPYRAFDGKPETYAYLLEQLRAVLADTEDRTAGLANAASVFFLLLPKLNWAGFYLMKDGALVLGPFQGRPACIRIAYGKGVCGTAWKEERCLRVSDVHAFPGHIACDAASRSEIVLPVRSGGRIVAVLDIDSPVKERFTAEDEEVLTAFAGTIGERAVFPESF